MRFCMWMSSLEGRRAHSPWALADKRTRKRAACCCMGLAGRKGKVNDRATSRLRPGTRGKAGEGSPRVDRGRRKDHSRGRRRNGRRGIGRKRSSTSDGTGCLFCSCHEVASAFISCLLFLLFAPDWKFFLRISLFHPPPWGCFILFPPPFSSVSKWKANSVALSEAGSTAGHFSPDRVPRRGRRR